jgi:hypothetical protein
MIPKDTPLGTEMYVVTDDQIQLRRFGGYIDNDKKIKYYYCAPLDYEGCKANIAFLTREEAAAEFLRQGKDYDN